MIGQSSLSAHLQLKVKASVAISICLGPVCGGVQANGFCEAAMGTDMALIATTGGALGLDADGSGSLWTLESKLTNYAEYPSSAGVSMSPCHHTYGAWIAVTRSQALKAMGCVLAVPDS